MIEDLFVWLLGPAVSALLGITVMLGTWFTVLYKACEGKWWWKK